MPWQHGMGRAGTSRMSREAHVRIWGGLEVQFLRSTRRPGDLNRCMRRSRWRVG